MSTQDLAIPHQLCPYCIDFVGKARNFGQNVEDPLQPGFDNLTDKHPTQYLGEIYPSLRSVFQFGNKECHLCSILTSAISETESRAAPTKSHNVEVSNASKNLQTGCDPRTHK